MPWMLVMLCHVFSHYWYRTFIQTYSATSPLKSTLGNGQNFFAKLLSKSNNVCGSGSSRIFTLPLPQKKDRFHHFRFYIPDVNRDIRIKWWPTTSLNLCWLTCWTPCSANSYNIVHLLNSDKASTIILCPMKPCSPESLFRSSLQLPALLGLA